MPSDTLSESYQRRIPAVVVAILVVMAFESLNGIVLKTFPLYPGQRAAGVVWTLVLSAATILNLNRRVSRYLWIVGLVLSGVATWEFFDLHEDLTSNLEFNRHLWERALPALYGLIFGPLAWTPAALLIGVFGPRQASRRAREGLYQVRVPTDAAFHVVFVHGVDGHWRETWQVSGRENCFWPEWIADGFPEAGVWSLQYNVATSRWRGITMPLLFRGGSVLDICRNYGVFARPTIFVAHSFGGLVVKSMWRHAWDNEQQDVKESVAGVIFIATPHQDAALASFMQNVFVSLPTRPTVTVKDLTYANPLLLDLNDWYLNHPIRKNIVYYETQATKGITVVNAASARMPGVDAVAMPHDHILICKPETRDDQIVLSVKRNIEEIKREF